MGLVAYALFKKAVREEAKSSGVQSQRERNPSETTVKTYRAASEQLLTDVVGRAIEGATPEIQESAILTAVENAQINIESHITERTGFGSALVANVAAWLFSLALTAIIVLLAARPSVEQVIADAAKPKPAVEQPMKPGQAP